MASDSITRSQSSLLDTRVTGPFNNRSPLFFDGPGTDFTEFRRTSLHSSSFKPSFKGLLGRLKDTIKSHFGGSETGAELLRDVNTGKHATLRFLTRHPKSGVSAAVEHFNRATGYVDLFPNRRVVEEKGAFQLKPFTPGTKSAQKGLVFRLQSPLEKLSPGTIALDNLFTNPNGDLTQKSLKLLSTTSNPTETAKLTLTQTDPTTGRKALTPFGSFAVRVLLGHTYYNSGDFNSIGLLDTLLNPDKTNNRTLITDRAGNPDPVKVDWIRELLRRELNDDGSINGSYGNQVFGEFFEVATGRALPAEQIAALPEKAAPLNVQQLLSTSFPDLNTLVGAQAATSRGISPVANLALTFLSHFVATRNTGETVNVIAQNMLNNKIDFFGQQHLDDVDASAKAFTRRVASLSPEAALQLVADTALNVITIKNTLPDA